MRATLAVWRRQAIPDPRWGQRVTRYAPAEMIRFVGPVATLGVLLVVTAACGAAAPASTLTAQPKQTEQVSSFQPVTTPETTVAPPAGATDSTTSLDTGTDRPTTVNVTLSTGIYTNEYGDGTFTSAGTARQCGTDEFGPRGFSFGFPKDIEQHHDVEDVTFGADELLPGTSTSSFSISVNIDPAVQGLRPATVLNPSNPQSGDSGTAQLSVVNGTRSLTVDAAGQGGVTIHLVAVCSPI